ncbi:MAG: Rieske (2Fe-2S) protein [Candidatus Bathyarchaeia archaeon]|jgi:3-phenylpropionate/trans-cinnamate dioxygenase ferredoxin subunit
MGFIKLASISDVKPNIMMGLEINDKKILLVNVNGSYYAIGNVCTHRGCQLSKGKLQGETVVCPCHGSTFDLKTGNFVKGPTKKPEPVYELKVENNDIMINL